jgi:hypothetical protein
VDHGDRTVVGEEFVDRIGSNFTSQDVLRLKDSFGSQLVEELVEEAQDGDGGDVGTVAMQHVRFEHAAFSKVVFENRQFHQVASRRSDALVGAS